MNPVTLALTGQLPFVILAAAVTAFPVSLFLLSLYRRKVVRTMNDCAGSADAASPVQVKPAEVQHREPLRLVEVSAGEVSAPKNGNLYNRLLSSPWRGARVYALGGLAFTLVMTLAVLISSKMELLPLRFALAFWVYGWPIVLALNVVGAVSRRDRLLTSGAYLLGLIALSALAVSSSSELTLAQVATLWLITNGPPTVLLLAFLARPIRAVGPIVLTFMLLAFAGSVLALSVAGSSDSLLRAITAMSIHIGASATGTFAAILVVGFVLFAVLGWLAVGWLRRSYLSKRLSDQSLSIDAMWLLFGIVQSVGLAFEGIYWILSGLFAFATYRLTVWMVFRGQATHGATVCNTRLVLLRVFSLGKRSERLFQRITRHWRYVGNVQLIAGPDLAMTTVEPHEFLNFVSGGLASSFIDGQATLDQRMKTLDTNPDFDRRFRVNDFFCYADTWETVLSRLVGATDVILMDLRSFSSGNAGCVRELKELIDVTPLNRVVLVVDNTTDAEFLNQTLEAAWQNAAPGSPNLAAEQPELRLVRMSGSGSSEIKGLLASLAAAAAA